MYMDICNKHSYECTNPQISVDQAADLSVCILFTVN